MSTNPYMPILFYSERCPNSKEVIGTIQALNKASLFRFVSVDTTPRHLLPTDLRSVPTVIFPDSKQVLIGKSNIFASWHSGSKNFTIERNLGIIFLN